jgi:glycosyltransferase involved in cell wall biosynthesis
VTGGRPIRLAVLDDGLFVATADGAVHPVAATFHRFVETVARSGPFGRVQYIVPVRALGPGSKPPALGPVDQSVLQIIPTAPFTSIADYVTRSMLMSARNWRPVSRALASADLLWLRLPASNGLLALTAARRHGVPHFAWLAGSASAVVASQSRPVPLRWAARAVAGAYDAISRLATRTGPSITLDAEMFSSIVDAADVSATRTARAAPDGPPWTLVWAGRMAAEKGLPELMDALGQLLETGRDVKLVLVGDGPERATVEAAARRLPADRVHFSGLVADRHAYLELLRSGHVLVHPSRAEGVPKVLVEAMAAGVPIVAAEVGGVGRVLDGGRRGRLVPAGDAAALADAIGALLDDPQSRTEMRLRGLEWADEHTAEAQAARLVAWLKGQFPALPWPA